MRFSEIKDLVQLMVVMPFKAEMNKKGNTKFKNLIVGILLGVVGLVIVISILANSDIASSLFPNWSALSYPVWLTIAFPFVIGLIILLALFGFLDMNWTKHR